MCRLLGYVTRTPTTLADFLGEQDLQDFAEWSRKHGDGWGFARAVGDVMEVTKAADAARTSALFSRFTHQILADLAVVHLRWATMGLPVADCNAHPFSDGRTAFAHNGWIRPEYYHLQWRSTPEAVVVASSGWGAGWVSLENGQLLVIERSTLSSTVLPLHEEAALR